MGDEIILEWLEDSAEYRARLALGLVQNLPVVTADKVWRDVPSKVVIKLIR